AGSAVGRNRGGQRPGQDDRGLRRRAHRNAIRAHAPARTVDNRGRGLDRAPARHDWPARAHRTGLARRVLESYVVGNRTEYTGGIPAVPGDVSPAGRRRTTTGGPAHEPEPTPVVGKTPC